MYIHIDVSHVPPTIDVREQENFTQFKVVVSAPEHAYVQPEALTELAGRATDAAWTEQLTGMVRYAASKRWVDADGGVRGHIEVRRAVEMPGPDVGQPETSSPNES